MIFNYKQFSMNESKSDSAEKILNLFETDLIEQPFMQDIFGKDISDYELDWDTSRGPEGPETEVWIEVKNPSAEAMKLLDSDYNKFAAPFVEWAKKHDLYNPSILSTDDSLSFNVTII